MVGLQIIDNIAPETEPLTFLTERVRSSYVASAASAEAVEPVKNYVAMLKRYTN